MATRRRSSPSVFDEAPFQEGLADLKRLVGDDSGTSRADTLPEGPDEIVALVARRKHKTAWTKTTAAERRTEGGTQCVN
jgi:hypothetical protein